MRRRKRWTLQIFDPITCNYYTYPGCGFRDQEEVEVKANEWVTKRHSHTPDGQPLKCKSPSVIIYRPDGSCYRFIRINQSTRENITSMVDKLVRLGVLTEWELGRIKPRLERI
jgi:hypothetical protein